MDVCEECFRPARWVIIDWIDKSGVTLFCDEHNPRPELDDCDTSEPEWSTFHRINCPHWRQEVLEFAAWMQETTLP